jgi:putative flippase GtrA
MQLSSFLFNHRYARTLRFLIAGGTAAATDLGLLYVMTDLFHIWYLLSAVLAFGIAFGVSFTLQKFWTFNDRSVDGIHAQLGMYLTIALIGLGLNTLSMFALVDHFGLHYIAAQIIASAFIAVGNFFAYKHLIFTDKNPRSIQNKAF